MTLVAMGIAVWLAVIAVAGTLALSLGRAAAIGDANQHKRPLRPSRAAETGCDDRRAGIEDRRARSRPWVTEAPGRRVDDGLRRRELADARQAVPEPQAPLAEPDARSA